MILQVARAHRDARIEPAWDRMWADSYLQREMLDFCSTHKDPCWEDEREVRLFCCPVPQADARVFTGIASAPKIKKTPAGKRYVEIGHQWRPGIRPRRILIGTHANRDISAALGHYESVPEVGYAALPLAS